MLITSSTRMCTIGPTALSLHVAEILWQSTLNQYCIYTLTCGYESIVGIQPAKKERRKGEMAAEGPEPRVSLLAG